MKSYFIFFVILFSDPLIYAQTSFYEGGHETPEYKDMEFSRGKYRPSMEYLRDYRFFNSRMVKLGRKIPKNFTYWSLRAKEERDVILKRTKEENKGETKDFINFVGEYYLRHQNNFITEIYLNGLEDPKEFINNSDDIIAIYLVYINKIIDGNGHIVQRQIGKYPSRIVENFILLLLTKLHLSKSEVLNPLDLVNLHNAYILYLIKMKGIKGLVSGTKNIENIMIAKKTKWENKAIADQYKTTREVKNVLLSLSDEIYMLLLSEFRRGDLWGDQIFFKTREEVNQYIKYLVDSGQFLKYYEDNTYQFHRSMDWYVSNPVSFLTQYGIEFGSYRFSGYIQYDHKFRVMSE